MEDVVAPIVVMLVGNYPQTDSPEHPRMGLGKISHLSFSHITGTAAGGLALEPYAQSVVFLQGHPQQSLEAISLSDIDLVMMGGGTAQADHDGSILDADARQITGPGAWPEHRTWGVCPGSALYVRHVNGLNLNQVRFSLAQPDSRPAVYLHQSSDVNVAGLAVVNPASNAPARMKFVDCQDARVTGCVDRKGGKAFAVLEGADTKGSNSPGISRKVLSPKSGLFLMGGKKRQ